MAQAFLSGAKLGLVATLIVFGAMAALGWAWDRMEKL